MKVTHDLEQGGTRPSTGGTPDTWTMRWVTVCFVVDNSRGFKMIRRPDI